MASNLKVDQIEPHTQSMVAMKIGGHSNYMIPSFVGQLTSFRMRRETSQAFPFWNLASPDQIISDVTYPDYVEYLRSIKVEVFNSILIGTSVTASGLSISTPSMNIPFGTLIYFHSLNQFRTIVSNNTSTSHTIDEPLSASAQRCSIINFSMYESSFSGTGNGSIFTLTDNAQNRILLSALSEDAYYQGATFASNVITPINPSNWMVLRWGTNEANIASFSPSALTITLPSGSVTPTGNIELYPHRILNSPHARHKQIEDSTLINNGMQIVNGLRFRDTQQTHTHSDNGHSHSSNAASTQWYTGYTGGGSPMGANNPATINTGYASLTSQTNSNNGNIRVNQFTRSRGLGVYFYEYVGRVI